MPVNPSAVTEMDLGGEWMLRNVDGLTPEGWDSRVIAATVPGSVHTDLMAAGLIPDPYLDDNEALLKWVSLCDWEYSREFHWEPLQDATASLVFEGLDTVAEITVNGNTVASTRNMHRRYSFDVTDLLRAGSNLLAVTFASAVKYADAASLELGYRPHVNHHPYNAIRKMACSFGWDWGIDTATAGIWKSVALVRSSSPRLKTVLTTATVDGACGNVALEASLSRPATSPMTLRCMIEGVERSVSVPAGATSARMDIEILDPELWWPVGYGDPRLYDMTIGLIDGDITADECTRRIGFRTVVADMTPDDDGTPFALVVNGIPVWVKGANWIPDDAFPHRVDADRYLARLDQALFANINLLRVWGGGIYEKNEFYDLCDEKGILTWQDFLFACAAYSEAPTLADEIEAEARDNVARLAHHPSLVVFNGNNENLWGFDKWNWQPRLQGKTWGAAYYYETLPRIVGELAPQIVYTPGSPFSPERQLEPNNPAHGTTHIWDLWNTRDYPHYREYTPRFVAEFGWQGPPTWSTMTASISDSPLTPESPGMVVHQKAALGNAKLTDGLVAHLELPNQIDDWHWAMSLNQAVAVTTAIEHFRSLSPMCAGSIVWQLNDCWPVTSWAAVDGAGRAKPLLHALRHAYADRLVTIQPRGDDLVVVFSNDSDEEWRDEFSIQHLDFTGGQVDDLIGSIAIAARSQHTVEVLQSMNLPVHATREFIRANAGAHTAHWFFSEYKDSALESTQLETQLKRDGDSYILTVTAQTLVRDLALLIDRVDPDAQVDGMLHTLLPGESTAISFRSTRALTVEEVTAPRVLRSANQLVSAGPLAETSTS